MRKSVCHFLFVISSIAWCQLGKIVIEPSKCNSIYWSNAFGSFEQIYFYTPRYQKHILDCAYIFYSCCCWSIVVISVSHDHFNYGKETHKNYILLNAPHEFLFNVFLIINMKNKKYWRWNGAMDRLHDT